MQLQDYKLYRDGIIVRHIRSGIFSIVMVVYHGSLMVLSSILFIYLFVYLSIYYRVTVYLVVIF